MENKTIIIDSSLSKSDLKSCLENFENTNIIFLHITEYIGDIFSSHENYIEVINLINSNLKIKNNNLYVFFGGHDSYRYEILKELKLSNIEFFNWPTFLLHYTYYMMKQKYGELREIKNEFNKLYVSLNQKPKQHRAMFIDSLHKNNLTDYGLFSWNELLNEWSNNYEFQYWNEEIVRVDIKKNRELLDVRKDYFTDDIFDFGCLFNIIGESVDNNDMLFITEKTYKNLLIGQPFICIGSPYQNKILKNFGFLLYDEVIDYSFDEKSIISDRVNGVIENLERLKNIDPNEIYKVIEKKVLHNIKVSYDILHKDTFIPNKLVELYKNSPSSFRNYDNSYMDVHTYLYKIFEYL